MSPSIGSIGSCPIDPFWIEEPTSPDDILGHAALRTGIAPIKVATGEHVHDRVMFKQLLQAGAIYVTQIDAARVGGINENVAILLLAAKFRIPVCPHAGRVGLCEMVRHLSRFDFVASSASVEGRAIEFVDHLHGHFVEPAVVQRARYLAPTLPSFSSEMRSNSLAEHLLPTGVVWAANS